MCLDFVRGPHLHICGCCDRKSRAACAQSFALWQQATIEITQRDHSITACSRHMYIVFFFTQIPFVVNHTLTQRHRRGCNMEIKSILVKHYTRFKASFKKSDLILNWFGVTLTGTFTFFERLVPALISKGWACCVDTDVFEKYLYQCIRSLIVFCLTVIWEWQQTFERFDFPWNRPNFDANEPMFFVKCALEISNGIEHTRHRCWCPLILLTNLREPLAKNIRNKLNIEPSSISCPGQVLFKQVFVSLSKTSHGSRITLAYVSGRQPWPGP